MNNNPYIRQGILFAVIIFIGSCSPSQGIPLESYASTPHPTSISRNIFYVDGNFGSDSYPGSKDLPWQTIEKATNTLKAGDLVYVRGGEYPTVYGGWNFKNSGEQSQPITLSNYPGEQAIFFITDADKNYGGFRCWYSPLDPESWQTPKTDYIQIIGTDVPPRILSNGVSSKKGIVIHGVNGEASGIESAGCDNWEIAGIDFINVPFGIFTKKRNFETIYDYSSDNWYVHDNRVYGYYSVSGMQFNGNQNLIENNEIYKVVDTINSSYGCQLLNLLGNNNIVRGNMLSRLGSKANCLGILFEWDLADNNLITQNTIVDVPMAIVIGGGDNNIIKDNYFTAATFVYNCVPAPCTSLEWPWNETIMDADSIPANDPAASDFVYYYPHTNNSLGNVFQNNSATIP